MDKISSLAMFPCIPQEISKRDKSQIVGMPKASPLHPLQEVPGHFSTHYIFIVSYNMSCSWSVFIFLVCFLLFCSLFNKVGAIIFYFEVRHAPPVLLRTL